MASASSRRTPTSTRTSAKPSLRDSARVSARRYAQRSLLIRTQFTEYIYFVQMKRKW